VDVIFASPPCQAWSPAGTHTPGDKRINVMGAVVGAALRLLPQTLLVENVPEMLWSAQWLQFEKLLSGAG
jgi:site-specific DNA-cytosine methylase